MRPLEQSTEALVRELQNLLRDRYESSEIIKELVQNADDAGARELHVALVDGLPGTSHPLLSSPSVIILNDGAFTEPNETALSDFGAGSKAADKAAIGKFGLGMKSVFHWCEAFIYSYSENQPAANGRTPGDVISPWFRLGDHDDWNLDAKEISAIGSFVEQWKHDCQRWFCLWLPLRSKQQLRDRPPIQSIFPGPGEVSLLEQFENSAITMPLLKSLTRVAFWRSVEESLILEHEILLEPGSTRRDGGGLTPGVVHEVSGTITLRSSHATSRLLYCGREIVAAEDTFVQLQRRETWPHSTVVIDGGSQLLPDKADPHGAVIFIAPEDGSDGGLVIRKCVFLPLSEQTEISGQASKNSANILLHGQFFLDSGRKRLMNDDEWNIRLHEYALSPLLLPSLRDFVLKANLSPERTRLVVLALKDSSFYRRHSDSVCLRSQWLPTINGNDHAWKLCDSAESYYTIPCGEKTLSVALRTFPSLAKLSERLLIVPQGIPRLTCNEPSKWEDKMANLLSEADTSALVHQECLGFLCDLIEAEHLNTNSQSWAHVVALVQRALSKGKLPVDSQAFHRLCDMLPDCRKVYLGNLNSVKESERAALHAYMLGNSLDFMLLPGDVTDAGRQIAIPEASILMKYLSEGEPNPSRSVLALLVLRATSGSRAEKLAALGNLRLFRAQRLSDSTEDVYTWQALEGFRLENQLLSGTTSQESLSALRLALINYGGVKLTEEATRIASSVLFDGESLPEIGADHAVDVLARTPPLAAPRERGQLLKLLLKSNASSSPEMRKAVRYLLHEDSLIYNSLEVDLFADTEGGGAWGRVAKWIMQSGDHESRLLPPELTRLLTLADREEFGIITVNQKEIEPLLKQNPDSLMDCDLTDDERSDLLRDIRDPMLWRDLPIHSLSNGQRVCVSEHRAFLVKDYQVPDVLDEMVDRIIPLPGLETLYENTVPTWGPKELIRVALSQPTPLRYAHEILEALDHAQPVPPDLCTQLRETPWLPLDDDATTAIKPIAVVHIPGLEDRVERLASDSVFQGLFYDESRLCGFVRDSRSSSFLRDHLYTSGQDAVSLLGEVLSMSDEYHIGTAASSFDAWMGVMRQTFGAGGNPRLPGHSILVEIDAVCSRNATKVFAGHLALPMSMDLTTEFLRAIKPHVISCSEGMAIYNDHLRVMVWSEDFCLEDLAGLYLLNQFSRWKRPCELTIEHGIAPQHVLDSTQMEILEEALEGANGDLNLARTLSRSAADSSVRPEEYFRDWIGPVNHEPIGLFLAMLGDGKQTLDTAKNWLEPQHDIRMIRESVGWNGAWESFRDQLDDRARDYLQASDQAVNRALARFIQEHQGDPQIEHLREMLRKLKDIPRTRRLSYSSMEKIDVHTEMTQAQASLLCLDDGEPLLARNLLGQPIEVHQAGDFDDLLIGEPAVRIENGDRHITFRLRHLDSANLSGEQLRSLLYNTMRVILNTAFEANPTGLSAAWDRLAESSQMDIGIAQRIILDNAFFYFKQLHDSDLCLVQGFARKWDNINYRRYEYREARQNNRPLPESFSEQIRKDQEKLLRELREAFEQNADFQKQTLTAVRRRVSEYQYRVESIPFELFQNADDALVELRNAEGSKTLEDGLVTFEWSTNSLRVCHWGRAINAFRFPSMSAQEAQDLGYHRDIEKMLVLSFSNKSDSGDTTGKFGLGFKSTFLFCDQPKILSGGLGFRVLGGMYPRRLETTDREELTDYMRRLNPESATPGTVVDLDTNGQYASVTAMERFCQLVHVQLAFSRALKECRLINGEHNDHLLRWREEVISEAMVSIGTLAPFRNAAMNAVVLRGKDNSALLLGLGATGFRRLSDCIPSFWVTAPTEEDLPTGFAVNGDFDLDVGRARISCSSQGTLQVADRLGDAIGNSLVALFDLSIQDWDRFVTQLRISPDTDRYGFWESLWTLLSDPNNYSEGEKSASGLLHHILWSKDRGIRRLLDERQVLPSGLSGEFRCLTRLCDISHVVEGLLVRSDVFAKAVDLLPLRQLAPGRVISSNVYSSLKKLTNVPFVLPSLRLIDIVKADCGPQMEITPNLANRLGLLINDESVKKWADGEEHGELTEINSTLHSLQFAARDGVFRPCRDLLQIDGDSGEEALRAAFAPEGHLLGPEYDTHGIAFFRTCRLSIYAPAIRLVEWGLTAESVEKRRAFMRYLIYGELAGQSRREIRSKRNGTWLEDPDVQYFSELPTEDARELRFAFCVLPGSDSEQPSPSGYHPSSLRDMEVWWNANMRQALAGYDQLVYPEPEELFSNLKSDFSNTLPERQAWLELLLRGSLETMGRARPEQHREFLRLCRRRGWLERLAEVSDHNVSTKLVEMIQEYIDQEAMRIEYFQWIKQFVPIFLLSRWLEDYVRAILYSSHLKNPTTDTIFRPRANSQLSGGGPDAPSIKEALGIGAHFVLRELTRKEVLEGADLHPLCYVPSARVRAFLGVQNGLCHEDASKDIYSTIQSELGDGTFGLSFDIPIQLYQWSDNGTEVEGYA